MVFDSPTPEAYRVKDAAGFQRIGDQESLYETLLMP